MLSFPCFLPTAAIRKRCNQALVTTVILLLSEFHRVSVSLFYSILFFSYTLVLSGLWSLSRRVFSCKQLPRCPVITRLFVYFCFLLHALFFSASTFFLTRFLTLPRNFSRAPSPRRIFVASARACAQYHYQACVSALYAIDKVCCRLLHL